MGDNKNNQDNNETSQLSFTKRLLERLTSTTLLVALVTTVVGSYAAVKFGENIENRKLQTEIISKLMELVGENEINDIVIERIMLLTSLVEDNKDFDLEFPTLDEIHKNKKDIIKQQLKDAANEKQLVINKLSKQIGKNNKDLKEKEDRLKWLEINRAANKDQINELANAKKSQKEALEKQDKKYKDEISLISKSIAQIKRERDQTENNINDLTIKLSSRLKEIEELNSEKQLAQQVIDDLNKKLIDKNSKIKDQANNIAILTSQNSDLIKRNKQLTKDIEELRNASNTIDKGKKVESKTAEKINPSSKSKQLLNDSVEGENNTTNGNSNSTTPD